MKTLSDLTEEIKNKISIYKENCIKKLYNGEEDAEWQYENTEKYIDYVYELGEEKKPVVIVADNPDEYLLFFNHIFNSNLYDKHIDKIYTLKNSTSPKTHNKKIEEIHNLLRENTVKSVGENQLKHHWLFITSEYSRVYLTWYKFLKDEFNLPCSKSEELDTLYEMINKAHIAKALLCKTVCLVLKMPIRIHFKNSNLHNISGPAIEYKNYSCYCLNGRDVPNWIFEKYFDKTLTFDDFKNCINDEDKSFIITIISENEGNEALLKFLNAELVDEQTLVHEGGHMEEIKLYKTKESYPFLQDSKGNFDVPYAWVEMSCPSTGQKYLPNTCPSYNNALDAIKFTRPKRISMDLEYIWESAN